MDNLRYIRCKDLETMIFGCLVVEVSESNIKYNLKYFKKMELIKELKIELQLEWELHKKKLRG